MAEPDIRTSSVYLVLERARWRYDPPRIIAMRQEKPSLRGGQVAVKVRLNIPMALFDEFIPVVEADIEEGDFIAEPEIEIEPASRSAGGES
jgi:hypothetical protein